MENRSFWRRIDDYFGFYHDERKEYIQGIAVRNAYVAMMAAAMLLAAFQAIVLEKPGILFRVGAAILFSFIPFLIKWFRFGKTTEADERVRRSLAYIFRWPSILLVLGLFVQFSYQFWVRQEQDATFLWTITFLVVPIVMVATHLLKNSALGHFWFWGVIAFIMGGVMIWIVFTFWRGVTVTSLETGTGPSWITMLWLVIFSLPVLSITALAAWGAWRSWQNERGMPDV